MARLLLLVSALDLLIGRAAPALVRGYAPLAHAGLFLYHLASFLALIVACLGVYGIVRGTAPIGRVGRAVVLVTAAPLPFFRSAARFGFFGSAGSDNLID